MYQRLTGGILLLGLLLLGQPVRVHADAPPLVVINELMWMGSSASSADEWVELRNLSVVPVDLSGWQLTRRSNGVEALMLTVPGGKSIAANGYFLIANNTPTALFGTAPNQKESPLAVSPDLVDASVSLLNSGLQVKVYAGAWNAGGALVDVADDGSGNPLAGAYDSAAGTYASMERNLTPGDGTLAANWHSATRSEGWDTGTRELGTPGAANSASAPIPALSAPASGTVGQPLAFDASESSDPEGRPLSFAWAFGDGATAAGVATNHTFTAVGSFSVQVMVSNGEQGAAATASVTVSEAVAEAAPPPPATPGDFVLSELQPSPSGEEFVEVVNRGVAAAELSGWVLTDGVHRFTIPAISFGAGALRSFPVATTGIHWNDDGDTAYLYAPDGSLRDAVRYTKTRTGWSLIRSNGAWAWTDHPTPGAANVAFTVALAATTLEAPEPPSLAVAPSAASGKTSGSGTALKKKAAVTVASVPLDSLHERAAGTTVRVRGTVTAVPGTVAARTLYVAEGATGTAVYAAKAALPPVALGDRVEVTGRVSHVQRGDRLLVSRTADVRILGHGGAPAPLSLGSPEIDTDAIGTLVTFLGTLTDSTSSRLVLDDGSGEVAVRRLKGTTAKVGDTYTVTGIVVGSANGVTVIPRAPSDVQHAGVVAAAETSNPLVPTAKAATTKTLPAIDAPKPDSTGHTLLLFGGALLFGAAVIGLLRRFAPQLWDPKGRPRSRT